MPHPPPVIANERKETQLMVLPRLKPVGPRASRLAIEAWQEPRGP